MSSSNNPNDPNAVGQDGTARIDAPAGPAGTARIDVQGPAGTARIDAQGSTGTARVQAQGPAGTARLDAAPDTGAGGTQRMGTNTHAAAAAPPVPTDAAQLLGVGQTVVFDGRHYRIDSELSTTTSEARTYVVSDAGQQRVLKHYRPGVRAPQTVLSRIQATPNRNVVSIIDFGSQAGQDFEILSYMAGGTLDQLLRTQGPIRDVALLRLLTAQIVDGLAHLHERVGVIYQDLKPENILISGPDLAQVVLADFGISTLREADSTDVQVTANGTREYAAPELARFGNETKTFVTDKVDYFALGITLLECWLGTRPFQGMMEGRRAAMIQDRDVPFPPGMDASLETLIKGLSSPSTKDRFGQEQVRRWIAGQPLTVDYRGTQRRYELKHFPSGEGFQTPEQLALLMEKYPEIGKDFLFYDSIQKWLDASGEMGLSTDIRKIVVQYNQDEDQRNAGLLRAIYVLDKNRPFTSAGGRTCASLEDMADALLAEKAHYLASLKNPFDPFYLYMHARAEGEFAAETLSRFVSPISAELAFNQLVYAMHGAGRNRIRIAGQYFFLPEELKDAPAAVHAEIAQSLAQPQSRLLLWLQRLGFVEKLAPLALAAPQDQLGILRALPWLRLIDFVPDLMNLQGQIAIHLIRYQREDLLDVFLAQGLGFNAPYQGQLPLVHAVLTGNLALVNELLDHGADIGAVDGDGHTALAIAIQCRLGEVMDLLLSRGGDVHTVDAEGRTGLGHALSVSNYNHTGRPVDASLVDRLLAVGADPNQPTHGGSPPLHLALVGTPMESAPGLVESLLKTGADIHRTGPNRVVKDQGPCNALFCALYAYLFEFRSTADYLPVIERLLQAGARLSDTDQDKAALHWAAAWGDEALARLLIAHGARTDHAVGDGMLAGTYGRLTGTHSLDSLLDPGSALRNQCRRRGLRTQLLKSLALLLLVAAMVPVGAALQFMWQAGRVDHVLWAVGITLTVLLAGHMTVSDSWAGFKSRLRLSLSHPAGWLRLFLIQPAVLALAAVGLISLMHLVGDDRYWLLFLGGYFWVTASVALTAVALVAVAIAARSGARTAALGRPLDQYEAAKVGGTAAQPAGWRSTVVMTIFLALLIVGPLTLMLPSGIRLVAGQNGKAPADTGTRSTGTPMSGAKALPGQKTSATDASAGTLTAPLPVNDRGSTLCVLPIGTRLTDLRDPPRKFAEPSVLATVPNPPSGCAARLAGNQLVIPVAKIRRGGSDSAQKPAKATEAAPVAQRVAEGGMADKPDTPPAPAKNTAAATAPAGRTVSGPVQGLSPDGWPTVAGQAMRLQGLTAIPPEQRKRFEGWLAAQENTLQCEPRAGGTFRCLTNARADVAEALLLNGASTTANDAPPAYKDAMARAMAEKRGQWK